MKILINTPSLKLLGGVSNHYNGLESFWNEKITYNTVGKRSPKSGSGIYYILWDLFKFIIRLMLFRPDVIILNPSLGKTAILRDSIFLNILHCAKKKAVIFIHGWEQDFANVLDKKQFIKTFNKASLILVLANDFKKQLKDWGILVPIELTTTKVDDNLLNNFDPSQRDGKVRNILFLSRIEKSKGIYETMNIFSILKERYPHLTLTIVGEGSELNNAKKYALLKSIPNVSFTGRLSGKTLVQSFKNADIYLFPSYGEGMPTSVLEAMGFGLPVFTRKVGGLIDFFENGKMGFITDSFNIEDFVIEIIRYIDDAELTRRVSIYNAKYASENFYASSVANQLEKYCKSIV